MTNTIELRDKYFKHELTREEVMDQADDEKALQREIAMGPPAHIIPPDHKIIDVQRRSIPDRLRHLAEKLDSDDFDPCAMSMALIMTADELEKEAPNDH